MNTLREQHCTPYAGEAGLAGKALTDLHRWAPEWHLMTDEESCALQRDFTFANFAEALAFTDRVGALAKAELHFPEITTEWGRVRVRWWTPTIKGLHRNDFVMAAKTDALYEQAERVPVPHGASQASEHESASQV
jgi:4a-hydroxytetrahydrobiopterin dehydratase